MSSARFLARASAAGGFARLPVPLRGLVSGTLGRSERVFWVRRAGAGFVLVNGAQGFSARFSDSGVRVSARGGRLALSLAGVGYGSSLRPLGSRAPSADRNRVSYAVGPLTQWYENGPLGLEQGFTLRAPPAGAARGPVTIALRVGGSLRARLVGGGEAVDFIAPGGGVVLRYVGLRAIDARGRVLHAWLDATGGGLLVRVDARGARYPLRIDPFVQQGSTLVGTGAVGDATQGWSVALSGDGNTALVGGRDDNSDVGAAWVFTRSGTTWTQQGPKLVGTGAVGHAGEGWSVALSGDGNTALVGGPSSCVCSAGAAWVFTRSGTNWTQQGAKLVGTGAAGAADQGYSVALSSDGNTALVGGYDAGAWVFVTQYTLTVTRSGSGTGTVTSAPAGIDCGGSCAALFDAGSSVTLSAAAATGSTFTGWTGCDTTSGTRCTVTMSADRGVAASFRLLPPGTKITKAKISSKHHQAKFSFKAIGTATGFQCALVKTPKKHHKKPKPTFKACRSPKTYKHLKPGKYTFEVRAFNAGGADSTSAKKSFTIT